MRVNVGSLHLFQDGFYQGRRYQGTGAPAGDGRYRVFDVVDPRVLPVPFAKVGNNEGFDRRRGHAQVTLCGKGRKGPVGGVGVVALAQGMAGLYENRLGESDAPRGGHRPQGVIYRVYPAVVALASLRAVPVVEFDQYGVSQAVSGLGCYCGHRLVNVGAGAVAVILHEGRLDEAVLAPPGRDDRQGFFDAPGVARAVIFDN